jgi:cyclophilin family peptidyl-prolyl cis-trans isomerase
MEYKAEFNKNKNKYYREALSMARSLDPNSAGS